MKTLTEFQALVEFDACGIYAVTVGKDRTEYARCQKCNMLTESTTRMGTGYCADCTHGFDICDEDRFESLDDLIECACDKLRDSTKGAAVV